MSEDKWTYQGEPVTIVAFPGNAAQRIIFGAEVMDAAGDILKLPANQSTGIIEGLLDADGKTVNVRSAELLSLQATAFGH